MDAFEFFKARQRMCDAYQFKHEQCPLGQGDPNYCTILDNEFIESDEFVEGIKIVEKWAKENPEPPPKTIQDDFFERMPLFEIDELGKPHACAKRLGYIDKCEWLVDPDFNCSKCWQLPYSESNYAKADDKKKAKLP